MSDFRVVPSTRPLRGTLRVPADKSISHRAVILGTLAEGNTRVENFLQSETTRATVNCLRAWGAEIEEPNSHTLVVHGHGLHSLHEPQDILFCLGSGTTMRLLAGLAAGQNFLSILDGTPALKRRPMARIVEPLCAMGATIMAREGNRLPPLAIRGGNLRGIDYTLPIASAQVKSAILLAGLYANSPTTLREPGPSRDHTERMLQSLDAKLVTRNSDLEIQIRPAFPFRVPNSSFRIPNDFSSAAFFIVAALLVPGSELVLEQVGLNPTRTGLLDVLAEMGATIRIENRREENHEPAGDLLVRAVDGLSGVEVAGPTVPRMIDEFPIFAIAATQARGETHVREAAELRVKESDRIGALTEELRKMGAEIEPHADGFTIAGPTPLHGTRVNAHRDHRLAMSLAVAGLLAQGETVVEGWECVADSFPNFQELFTLVSSPG